MFWGIIGRVSSTSCDTLVALAPHTRGGHTLFAKNSDRPPAECQPLCAAPRRRHAPGARLMCQYVEIPEVAETWAVLGSRPWWLWGFEHGVNEHRVAIGNEALHTREAPAETGLLGMDLVRLGLERGRSAAEAMRAITGLLEAHGQGGSASVDSDRRYHNSFIIADPAEAWVVETSGRHWVARRVRDRAAISNCATIGDDWDLASDGIEAHARAQGWWTAPPETRLDFRAAFENPAPRYRAEARLAASCRFLGGAAPDVAAMMRHLRDHHGGGTVHVPGRGDGDPLGWSVCMHPGPGLSATAASLVAELPADPARPAGLWWSMGTPCTGVFLPVPLSAPLPESLTRGEGRPDPASAWWTAKALGDAVTADPAALTPAVQSAWGAREAEWLSSARAVDAGRLAERVASVHARRAELLAQVARPETVRGARAVA